MSTTHGPVIERCRPEEATPVRLRGSDLDSTSPEYLRDLKYELAAESLVPARLTVEARFEEDCSLSTQREVERLREHVRAAAFLGAGTLTVEVGEVANETKVRPALEACAERARREGVSLDLDGPIAL